MKLPKQLKIGGHIYKVKLVDDGRNFGTHDRSKNLICIDPTIAVSQQGSTLIHEILHALNATWGDSKEGHMLLESISEQLYQVLSENKLTFAHVKKAQKR